jgi:hypothetical protein
MTSWTSTQSGAVLPGSLVLGIVGALSALAVSAQSKAPADLVAEGKQIFRYDTFGDERLWTDQLGMNAVVETVDPVTALKVGLKVDADALPPGTLESADLTSPATTVALLKLDAVVGLKATVDANNRITRLGVTCALCHSTVDDAVQKGIGHRRDGWPNRDLDVRRDHRAVARAAAGEKDVYNSWGPGKYDPRYNIDGKSTPLVLPPAYGLAKIKNETYTAEGPISYWNAYVAVTQMGGQGHFSDPALGINVALDPDLVTPKLPALRAYQHSLPAPRSAGGQLRFGGGPTRAHGLQPQLHGLPRGRRRHRQQWRQQAACAGGNRDGRRLRRAHQKQGVSDNAPAGPVAAPAVLP